MGVKGSVGGLLSYILNTGAQLQIQGIILANLSLFGETGTLGVGVKSVDIERNADRESRFLGQY